MPKKSGFISLFILVIILTLTLGACGDPTATYAPATTSAAATTAGAPAAGNVSASGPPAAATVAPGSKDKPANAPQTQAIERKVIRNANLSIEVTDMEQALTRLRSLAVAQGGIVFQENSYSPNDRPTAVFVLQIPSENYEISITQIRQIASKVTRQESTAQDVTEEYVDVQSQIANLKITEAGLQKLIDKATKLEEILSLQKELTSVRGEIEKRQGRLNFLGNRSALSTITINLSLPPAAEKPTSNPGPQTLPADKAVSESWEASIKILNTIFIACLQIAVFLWWAVPFLLVGLIWWWRKRVATRKNQRASS